jgi:hypothetical protein
MRKAFACVAAAMFLAAPLAASEWKGTISDARCAGKHDGSKHSGTDTSHRDCVEKCVTGGQPYVFVVGDKTYKIANQDFAGLKTHAAHQVVLTGEMKNDTITVSKIEMPKKEAPRN